MQGDGVEGIEKGPEAMDGCVDTCQAPLSRRRADSAQQVLQVPLGVGRVARSLQVLEILENLLRRARHGRLGAELLELRGVAAVARLVVVAGRVGPASAPLDLVSLLGQEPASLLARGRIEAGVSQDGAREHCG